VGFAQKIKKEKKKRKERRRLLPFQPGFNASAIRPNLLLYESIINLTLTRKKNPKMWKAKAFARVYPKIIHFFFLRFNTVFHLEHSF
jgi:hypothetical protein